MCVQIQSTHPLALCGMKGCFISAALTIISVILLVYIWLHFHANLLLVVYLTFYYPLFSLCTLQSQSSVETRQQSLAPCSYFAVAQHPVCLHHSALSLHSSSLPKVTSDFHTPNAADGSPSLQSCSAPVTAHSSLHQSLPLASNFRHSSAFSSFSSLYLSLLCQLMHGLPALEFLDAQASSLFCLYSLLFSWMVKCMP